MIEAAILLRNKQLVVHNMHNNASKVAFLADHDYLGEIYGKAESQYDGIIERLIGLGQTPDLNSVQIQAAQKLAALPPAKDNGEMFSQILMLNKQILQVIEAECRSGKLSQGSLQLLGGIADELEGECYKLVQRTKK